MAVVVLPLLRMLVPPRVAAVPVVVALALLRLLAPRWVVGARGSDAGG